MTQITDHIRVESERIKKDQSLSYIYRRGHSLYLNGQATVLSKSSNVFEFSVDDQYNDFSLRIEVIKDILYNCSCGSQGICPHKVSGLLQMHEDLSRELIPKKLPGIAYTREGMIKRVIKERRDKAKKAKYELHLAENIYGEHLLFNEKRRSYKITFHDYKREIGYCTCPDFTSNKLGTCKHLMWSFAHLKKHPEQLRSLGNEYPFVEVYLDPLNHYQISWFYPGRIPDPEISSLLFKFFGKSMVYPDSRLKFFLDFLKSAEQFKQLLIRPEVYHKVESAFNVEMLQRLRQSKQLDYSKMKVKLFRFQREGVEFATFREGAIIADEIGLGKSYQAIASAVFKKEIFDFNRTLVICPATLVDQWKQLIHTITDEGASVVKGAASDRESIYQNGTDYFLITNYEKISKDKAILDEYPPDFVILDEAHRIKNYETQTSFLIKSLKRKHVLALTGTPVDRKLTDLYSVAGLVSPQLLAPLWEFSQNHYYFDPDHANKITGYFNLDLLRDKLSSVLLRRDKNLVKDQLPEVTEINFPVEMSPVQWKMQSVFVENLKEIMDKKFLSPFDWQKIFQLLAKMRMLCDSTILLGEDKNVSPKLDELRELLLGKLDLKNSRRKVVVFSEWVKMNHQISKMLRDNEIGFVELHGSVAVDKRKDLIDRFLKSEDCQVFVSTETGGSGLNLQVADTIINFDLPLSALKKEQRLGRIDRLGQHSTHLTIINMMMKDSIESGIASGFSLKENIMENLVNAQPDQQLDLTASSDLMDGLQEIVESIEQGNSVKSDHELKLNFDEVNWRAYEEKLVEEILIEEEPEEENPNLIDSLTTPAKAAKPDDLKSTALEDLAIDGLSFFNKLYKLTTEKEVLDEAPDVKFDREKGELTIRLKLK
jgi:SNF2 family DNA or RNA helicase